VAAAAETDAARRRTERLLVELKRRRDQLEAPLLVDRGVDSAAWEQYGALMAAVDRFRVEVAAAVRPPEQEWRPPRVSERQRQAVRRVIDARSRRAADRRRGRRRGEG
jgi:wyosine [tRNA(Phe)-imidazoG37] synthetase (radical SAM superfamily)